MNTMLPFRYEAALESLDPDRNRFRRYEVRAEPLLVGGYALKTWRGRIGKRLRLREERCDSLEELLMRLAATLRRRILHGYRFVR